VAWCWSSANSRHLVVVNLSAGAAEAHVRLPWQDIGGRTWELTDRVNDQQFERSGDDLAANGLYVGLVGWASHFLAFAPSDG